FKSNVQGYDSFFLGNPEVCILAIIEAGCLAVLHVVFITERLQSLGVETLRAFVVTYRKGRVGNHLGCAPAYFDLRAASIVPPVASPCLELSLGELGENIVPVFDHCVASEATL